MDPSPLLVCLVVWRSWRPFWRLEAAGDQALPSILVLRESEGFWSAGLKELEALGMVVASDKWNFFLEGTVETLGPSPLALVYKLVIGSPKLRD